MERILHRANRLPRIQAAIEAGFARIEVDLRYRGGSFILCHDFQLGPLALGRSGAQFSRAPYLPIHWESPFVRLPDLLESKVPALFIDLKGRWSDAALNALAAVLRRANRHDDIVGSKMWEVLDRSKASGLDRPLVYALGRGELPRLMMEVDSGNRPFGVSVDAGSLTGADGLIGRLLDAKLAVYAWNLRTPEELPRLKSAGVCGAIFDDPRWTC